MTGSHRFWGSETWFSFVLLGSILLGLAPGASCREQNIRDLTQHFNDRKGATGEWVFVPEDNVTSVSLSEHPGLAVIRPGKLQKDIKGLLKKPIGIGDYPLPWEYQLGLAQNFDMMCGVGTRTQNNSAIGLNIALTFSDPATWPADRKTRPPKTYDFQLLVVHLGHGSGGEGLPQYTTLPHPERYLVWGRGDLDSNLDGDWEIPSVWVGDGSIYAGPASSQLFFRFVMSSPTAFQVGIKFDSSHGWNMRRIDCSRLGRVTGIWEVGPIFSQDRWIPDTLCPSLPKPRVRPLVASASYTEGTRMLNLPTPQPEPPNPSYEHYVDYCVFLRGVPVPLEDYSDEFDIPGYMGRWQIQPESTMVETYSKPGWLTMTLVGVGSGTGIGPLGGPDFDFKRYPPPWEIETCFLASDDTIPWNICTNLHLWNDRKEMIGSWKPGVRNNPVTGRHEFFNSLRGQSKIAVAFEPEVPEKILAAKPLYMLIQVIGRDQFRVAFKDKEKSPWYFSKKFTLSESNTLKLSKLGMGTWSTVTGLRWGAPPGGPMYQKFMIDYIRYRYGTTQPN